MQNLSWIETIYWASAIIGGMLFLFRLALFFIGGDFGDHDFDVDMDVDVDIDADLDQGDYGDHESAGSMKLLSLQGLTAFFMMFGLVGLALLNSDVAEIWTIFGGGAAGIFTMWVVGSIFRLMTGLQADGTMQIENAVGQEGSVYLTIPKDGSGQVRVSVQGSLRVMDAVSEDNTKIPTNSRVVVIKTINQNTLVVKKVE